MRSALWPLTLGLSVVAASGCSLMRLADLARRGGSAEASTPGSSSESEPASGGTLLLPKRNALKLVVLKRPMHDPVVDSSLWQVADEQVVDPEVRRVLEANGLRIGVITGDIPADVESELNAPPPKLAEQSVIAVGDGDSSLFALSPPAVPESVSLFLHREGTTVGKPYESPRGFLRLITHVNTTSADAASRVEVRIVPELHHGPIRRQIGADTNAGPFDPKEFVIRDTQEQEVLRDLASTVSLGSDQILIVGCHPDRPRSLGHYLFTEPEMGSDRLAQKVLMVWASGGVGTTIPWTEPVTPPTNLQPVEPSEIERFGGGTKGAGGTESARGGVARN